MFGQTGGTGEFWTDKRRNEVMQFNRAITTVSEDVLAELTSAAYLVVLRHGGVRAPFIDVQLDLWRELRQVLNAGAVADDPRLFTERL
jgi:hypothetical protein